MVWTYDQWGGVFVLVSCWRMSTMRYFGDMCHGALRLHFCLRMLI